MTSQRDRHKSTISVSFPPSILFPLRESSKRNTEESITRRFGIPDETEQAAVVVEVEEVDEVEELVLELVEELELLLVERQKPTSGRHAW